LGKATLYKCEECNHEFVKTGDGNCCPKCKSSVVFLIREATDEDIKKEMKKDKIKTKQIDISSKAIVILRNRGLSENIEDLEEKYSEKFGCKVIILGSNIDYVDKIDG